MLAAHILPQQFVGEGSHDQHHGSISGEDCNMRIVCSYCGKQAVSYYAPPWDKYITILEGARADFGNNCICGHCAKDMDSNGLFPDEEGYNKHYNNDKI